MGNDELQTAIEQEIAKFRELLGTEATVTCEVVDAERNGQKVVNVHFDGNDLGYMIGSHGRHLQSVQYILSLMVNRKFAENEDSARLYVNVDISGYKKEREGKVEEMALRAADDARILGESVDMDPMSASERRVVHLTLEKFDDLKTESYGEGPDRAVRIIPVADEELGLGIFSEDAEGSENEEEAGEGEE